jgi:proline utilization trans-activator
MHDSSAASDISTATYGFIDGEQAFSAALLLVMVNIAFPYNEENASAMETALLVLQSMAERGNKYIRACHSLLAKITATGKLKSPATAATNPGAGDKAVDSTGDQSQMPPMMYQLSAEEDRLSQSITLAERSSVGVAGEQQQTPTFSIDQDGDPRLWAGVLDSIGIDMDRHWAETTLLGEETSYEDGRHDS